MECEFSTPLNYLGNTPAEGEFWQFQNLTCGVDATKEIIQQDTTEFYLDKTFSYGDILITIFLSIFLVFGIFKLLWNFIWEQVIR